MEGNLEINSQALAHRHVRPHPYVTWHAFLKPNIDCRHLYPQLRENDLPLFSESRGHGVYRRGIVGNPVWSAGIDCGLVAG